MKLIIAGEREFTNPVVFLALIEQGIAKFKEHGHEVAEVVSGTCEGIDTLGEIWAASKGIPVKRFPADWERRGNWAGHLRNDDMAQYADALLVIWEGPLAPDGRGNGSMDMNRRALALGMPVVSILVTEHGKLLDIRYTPAL